MINKLECTCIEAYTTRNMRDPNCCACYCDHNNLVEQLANANERIAEIECYNVRLANESHEYQQRVEELEKSNKTLHKLMVSGEKRGIAKAQEEMQEKLNKLAVEKKIEALESCINDNAMDNDEIDALIIYVDDVRADIEQLRKEQYKC